MRRDEGTGLRQEIHEPYPGLRPFLDYEHALLKGRDSQIKQIVERLEGTHFVAIIGGSGCGKSSLVRAGVLPQLRTHAIESAGGYWTPIVFTPGTINAPSVVDEPMLVDAESPVTRLAWKFAQAMRPAGVKDVSLALRDEVAAFVRQGAGFSRLVRAYHHLLPRPGPRTETARFLFVIDQFEELFHPNNRGSSEVRCIVDAVIDHFLDPDERAYVVMTMRSEHLADCAAYLHLPEAINQSFYLVRRLNSAELRQVIIEPAQVMQRPLQRQDDERMEPVAFAPEVVARLLGDVRRIEDDPDHLPLLQHLLARIWSAALEREKLPPQDEVPRYVTMADLEAAVAPASDRPYGWLAEDRQVNTLRSSLENWAEHIYSGERDEVQQRELTQLLRQLAFKDPNNGLYFQQRVQVDDPALLPGISQPRDRLWSLLEHGFLDTVNYLFWDAENPAHVTLKVSHEAFIRGWSRFRRIVDREADRFDEFVAVMRRCATWDESGKPEDKLLGGTELARVGAADLLQDLQDNQALRRWLAMLRLYRGDERLLRAGPEVPAYLARSRERQERQRRAYEEQQRRVEQVREERRLADEQQRIASARHDAELATAKAKQRGLIAFLALLAMVVAYVALVLWPATWAVDRYTQAREKTDLRPLSERGGIEGGTYVELGELVNAARLALEGRGGLQWWLPVSARSLRESLDRWLPPLTANTRMVEAATSEPLVTGNLRRLMTTAVWDGNEKAAGAWVGDRQRADHPCEIKLVGDPRTTSRGLLLPSGEPNYGLFVPRLKQTDLEVTILEARFKPDGADCVAERVAFSVPLYLRPAILLDALGTTAAVVREGQAGKPDLTLYDINWNWDRRQQEDRMRSLWRTRRVVTDPRVSQVFREHMPAPDASVRSSNDIVQVVPTRRVPGGIEVTVKDLPWLLLLEGAQPVDVDLKKGDWHPLTAATVDSPCGELSTQLVADKDKPYASADDASRPRVELNVLEDQPQGRCVVISRFDINRDAPPSDLSARSEVVSVTVYHASAMRARVISGQPGVPAPVAAWTFGQQVRDQPREWWVGPADGGPWDGWLAATAPGQQGPVLASPFSTFALKRLADELLKRQPLVKQVNQSPAPVTASTSASAPPTPK